MAYRTRIKYTPAQTAEIWDRWQRGESLTAIGRLFDRPSSSLAEREEISRGLACGLSLRTIAARVGRAPSTIS